MPWKRGGGSAKFRPFHAEPSYQGGSYMKRNALIFGGLCAAVLAGASWGMTADVSLSVKNAGDFKKYFEVVSGDWIAGDSGVIGAGPCYHSLPGTALAGFVDDAHTYFVVHAVNLWRYALAGSAEWDNYTVAATLRILEPAPLKGVRPGQDCVF